MNGAAGEKQEAEKRIKEYIQASTMGLSKKEEQDFNELVFRNEETAKKYSGVQTIQGKRIS